jgi:LacI family transcriptional regulator
MAGITAKELAMKLGLSPAAVSLALNGRPGVSAQTRERVLEAAMQLGYSKSEATQHFHTGKTICFIRYGAEVVNVAEHTSFSSFILQGVEARASELGYNTQVRYLSAGDVHNRQIMSFVRQAAGVIFLGTDLTEHQLPAMEQFLSQFDSCPVVIVDSLLMADRVDCVGNDGFGGARLAIRHLIDRGCRRIGYVKSKQRIPNMRDRERGLIAALQEAGLPAAVQIPVDISAEGALADFESWLEQEQPMPDGLFVDNDILATSVLRALKRHNYRIPEDVSVIGFDDIPMCEMLEPPLSTVRLAKAELGTVAMDHLQHRIVNGQVPHRTPGLHLMTTVMSTRLVARSSVRK